MAFLRSVPASGCASVAALASALCAAGTQLPGLLLLRERAGSAVEA